MPEAALGPTVAVVIPCHNAETTIGRTIRSVLAQGVAPGAIIVVDDGSGDSSVAVAQGFGVRVLTGPNGGACAARNRGLAGTDADYVMFLDADDELAGDHLLHGVQVAQAQGADLVVSPMILRTDLGVIEARDRLVGDLGCEALFRDWLLGIQVNPSAMLWRREFVVQIGGWDERVMIQQDGELALRAFLNRAVVGRNPRGYGIYYVRNPASLAASKSAAKEANYVETLARLLAMTRGTAFADKTDSLEDALYRTARMAFVRGWPQVGRQALGVLATIGPLTHRGTWRHRMLAGLLGLERKVRLWGA